MSKNQHAHSLAGNAALHLLLDQRLKDFLRFTDMFRVLLDTVFRHGDVIPRAHDITAVNGHRPERRLRKHETQRGLRWQAQLGNKTFKVMAVGAQTVQPDDAGQRALPGFDHYRRFVARVDVHTHSVLPAIDTSGGASLAHHDFGKPW